MLLGPRPGGPETAAVVGFVSGRVSCFVAALPDSGDGVDCFLATPPTSVVDVEEGDPLLELEFEFEFDLGEGSLEAVMMVLRADQTRQTIDTRQACSTVVSYQLSSA